MKEKVIPVLTRLPILPEQRGRIEEMAIMIAVAFVVSRTGDIPRMQSGGTMKAARMLTKLRKNLDDVALCIHEMPSEAH